MPRNPESRPRGSAEHSSKVPIDKRVADEKKKGGREGVLCIELACCKLKHISGRKLNKNKQDVMK